MTTEFSPFAPPTLGDAPAGAAPPPPPITPSLPAAPPLPTLAPLPSPAPPPAPIPAPPATTASPATPAAPSDPEIPPAPSEPPPAKRSHLPVLLLILLGIVTIGGAVWFALATSDEATTSTTSPQPPTSVLDIAPQDVSSPVVEPIDDARDVIADIDENTEEAEALDLLGLDETGNPATVANPVLGHRFTWNFGTEETATITVDDTNGNYELVSGDGLEQRHVDGRSYGRRDGSTWAEVDAETLESIEPLGLDGPLTVDQVIDPMTAEYTASVTEPRDDGTLLLSAEVDAFDYVTAQPDDYTNWMALLGHPESETAVQPGAVVVVQAEVAADGTTINLLTVTSESFATSYTLDELFETAPAIDAPEL